MRAAPTFRVDVDRFGASRAGLGLLVLASAGVLCSWQWFGRESASALRHGLVFASLVAIAWAAWRPLPGPFRLRWDGEAWHVGPQPSTQAEPWSGRLGVAIDLGAWMLLRFAPSSGPPRCPYRWLPVQRNGLEAQWHPLRGAVYSARPGQPLQPSPSLSARPDPTPHEP